MEILQKYYELCKSAGAYLTTEGQKRHFEVAVSLILSQGPGSFKQAQLLRRNLYLKIGNEYTPRQLVETLPLLNHLPHKRKVLLEQVAERFEKQKDGDDGWKRLPGIGLWTVKGFEIMTGTDQRIVLREDSHVKKRMKQVGVAWGMIAPGWETRMSRLFWRLTDYGAVALRSYLASGYVPTQVNANEFY